MPWNNYPKAARDNASKALKHREENGTDCGTPVGWQRANTLSKGDPISDDVLVRTYSFLSRAKVYDQGKFFDEDGKEICGSIMYAAWGGDEMLRWAKRTIEQMEGDRAISDLSATAKKGLENKVEEHNEEFGDTKTKRVTLGMLTKVYERGIGAYNTNPSSVRPSVSSPEQWAMARVNSFLYAVRNEKFKSGKHDTDLFPDGHPLKSDEEMKENKRHIKSVVETDEEIVITFGKSEMEENGYKDEERAEPNELSVGDFVKWNSSGGNAYGRIIQVENNGEIEADSGFVLNGTSDDPAALIRLFRYSNEEDAYIERKPVLNVVHPFSRLEAFDAEVRKSSGVIEQREFRMESMEHNGNVVRGYAAVYDSDSEFMGYYEQIEKGAFDDVMNDDVRAYYNHDENYLLGRVSSGTLRIGTDKRGLYYEVDLPNTTYANDLVELMKRGDINQSSFAFLIGQDRWEERDGKTYRIIEKVSRLIDVSPVAMPAYQMATSELKRDLETETPPIETTPPNAGDSGSNDGEEVSNIYLYKSKILNLTR